MTTPTPEQLAMARRIAADISTPEDCALRDKYLSGVCDPSVQVRTALAAIIKTSALRNSLLIDVLEDVFIAGSEWQKGGAAGRFIDARDAAVATALRNYAHLTGAPK